LATDSFSYVGDDEKGDKDGVLSETFDFEQLDRQEKYAVLEIIEFDKVPFVEIFFCTRPGGHVTQPMLYLFITMMVFLFSTYLALRLRFL